MFQNVPQTLLLSIERGICIKWVLAKSGRRNIGIKKRTNGIPSVILSRSPSVLNVDRINVDLPWIFTI